MDDRAQLEALGLTVLSLIGSGTMGDVWLVRDQKLNRHMAIKVLRETWLKSPDSIQRFLAEAQTTAQLEHPGIVPVHGLLYLSDGRPCFTMKEVRGRTLEEVISAHHSSKDARNLRRLIDTFHRVCEAVAYAHARGVLHRDLKPSNIMLGDFGEVLVLDWGLARIEDAPVPVVTARSGESAHATRVGTISGTPVYMPPEQARGSRLEPTADVYALGAILYEILTGAPPYKGKSAAAVLAQVVSRPPPRPGLCVTYPLPPELEEICSKAMARRPSERFPNAHGMAVAVGRWMDGAQRRERGLALVAEARSIEALLDRLQAEARQELEAASRQQAALSPLAPLEEKAPAWELEDRAREKLREGAVLEVGLQQKLGAALSEDPELAEAHEALADHYQRLHEDAELTQNLEEAARLEILLRTHDRGKHAAWLQGAGRVTLVTDPPGASVEVSRFVLRNRRLEPVHVCHAGESPLLELPLSAGSYLLTARYPGRIAVHIPVALRRLEHWDGIPPGGSEPYPIRLPAQEDIGDEECYVPAGWFLAGENPHIVQGRTRNRIWVNEFFMQRHPVTHRQYLEFMNDLVKQGDEEAIQRAVPRIRVGVQSQDAFTYARHSDGHFNFALDGEGDIFDPDTPVVTTTWHGARDYGRWYAKRTGKRWRLPLELEREKAGRGVDGRIYPWGDHLDYTFCCLIYSHRARPLPQAIHAFPLDRSLYGVQGLAGNTRDWCMDIWDSSQPLVKDFRPVVPLDDENVQTLRAFRGGYWSGGALHCRQSARAGDAAGITNYAIGFRLARSWG